MGYVNTCILQGQKLTYQCTAQIQSKYPWFKTMQDLMGERPNLVPTGLGHSQTDADFDVLEDLRDNGTETEPVSESVGDGIGEALSDSEGESESKSGDEVESEEELPPVKEALNAASSKASKVTDTPSQTRKAKVKKPAKSSTPQPASVKPKQEVSAQSKSSTKASSSVSLSKVKGSSEFAEVAQTMESSPQMEIGMAKKNWRHKPRWSCLDKRLVNMKLIARWISTNGSTSRS
jgi:hypothetical protein